MPALFLLVAIAFLTLPVAAFVMVLLQRTALRDLSQRIKSLEDRLGRIVQVQIQLRRRVDEEQPVVPAAPPPVPEPAPPEVIPVQAPAARDEALPTHEPAPAAPPPVATPPTASAPPVPPPAESSPAVESLERQLSTRVAVWLGAASLALAGAFLVKYSIERGLIGPTLRVVLGLGFGVALLGTAEWMRRRAANVAQGLAASGVAVLFAALLAGVRLYELIPQLWGILGLLVTTAVAVLLSQRHGQMVAILGLLGGFLTPLWIGGDSPRPWMLLTYLVLIQAGLMVVSRRMRWWPVASLTALCSLGWAGLWIMDIADRGGSTLPVGLLLLVSMVGWTLTVTASLRDAGAAEQKTLRTLLLVGCGLGVFLLAALVGAADFGNMEWAFLGILGAGAVVLARRESEFEVLPWLTMLAGAGMLLAWGMDREPGDALRLWSIAWLFNALYITAAYLALWGSRHPHRWAALAGGSALVYLLVAYFGLQDAPTRIPWGVQSLILAAAFVALSLPVLRRRDSLPQGHAALAALAVTITSLASLAIPMELERAWITVAWALEVPALAWIAARLRVPALQKGAWVLGGLVAIRLLLNPFVLTYPTGEHPVFNWLVYGYGIPAAAFVLAAALFRQQNRQRLATALEGAAILFVGALLTLEVRLLFHAGDLDALDIPLMEWGSFAVVWLVYSLGLLLLHRRVAHRVIRDLGYLFCLLGLVEGLGIPGLLYNPLFHDTPVGETIVLNRLLFLYALPALLAVLLARQFQLAGKAVASRLAGSAALAFAFLTITLEVRQAFHGTLLQAGETTNAEMYTYSLAWVLFATTLLVAGILTRGAVLRFGSAVIMLLSVGKVFLVDTAHLEGLLRVFSLLGLGTSLMLLAFLYQRFVFRDD